MPVDVKVLCFGPLGVFWPALIRSMPAQPYFRDPRNEADDGCLALIGCRRPRKLKWLSISSNAHVSINIVHVFSRAAYVCASRLVPRALTMQTGHLYFAGDGLVQGATTAQSEDKVSLVTERVTLPPSNSTSIFTMHQNAFRGPVLNDTGKLYQAFNLCGITTHDLDISLLSLEPLKVSTVSPVQGLASSFHLPLRAVLCTLFEVEGFTSYAFPLEYHETLHQLCTAPVHACDCIQLTMRSKAGCSVFAGSALQRPLQAELVLVLVLTSPSRYPGDKAAAVHLILPRGSQPCHISSTY